MPADIQVNSVQCYSKVQNGVWEYCSQWSLPLGWILRWFQGNKRKKLCPKDVAEAVGVSTGRWTLFRCVLARVIWNASFNISKLPSPTLFRNLRNKYSRDKKKIEGEKESGGGTDEVTQAVKTWSHFETWLVPYFRGFILELIALAYVTFLVLMQQVKCERSSCLCLCLWLCLCRSVNQAFKTFGDKITTCMHRNRNPCNSFFMVNLVSGMDRGRVC